MSKNKRYVNAIIWIGLFIMSFLYCLATINKRVGGDDQYNYLAFYNEVRDMSYIECIINWIIGLPHKLNPFATNRYFPLAGGTFLARRIFYSSVYMYRIWILLYTVIDFTLISVLIGRLTRNKYSAYTVMILVTLSQNMWRNPDVNTLTTYEALVQRTLMWELIALHMFLSWFNTNKKRYAVIGAICTALGCITYEIGYMTVFYVMALALFANLKSFMQYIKRIIPVVIGTIIPAIMYMITARNGAASDDTAISIAPNAIIMTTIKQMNSSFPLSCLIHGNEMVDFASFGVRDYIIPLIIAVVIAVCVYRIDSYPDLKDYIKYILLGISLLFFPALLISLTKRFQDSLYSDWTTGWIVTFVGTLGVAIITYVIIVSILCFINKVYPCSKIAKPLVIAFIFICSFATGTYSRLATLQNINNNYNLTHYVIKADALENGLMTYTDNVQLLISKENTWADFTESVRAFFIRYNAYSNFDIVFPDKYEESQYIADGTYYYRNIYKKGYCIPFIGKVDNDKAETISDVYMYIDYDNYDDNAFIKYSYYDANGDKQKVKAIASELGEVVREVTDKGYYIKLDNSNIVIESIKLKVNEAENEKN